METVYELEFRRAESGQEEVERYEDYDDVRADFLYMTQEHPDDYDYVILYRVETDHTVVEDRTVIDRWEGGEQ